MDATPLILPIGNDATHDEVPSQDKQRTNLQEKNEKKRFPIPSSPPSSPRNLQEAPYSVRNELRFFFHRGVPLGLSAVLEWGVPPWMAMFMAGHAAGDTASLQSALGYGRVFYNITSLMPMLGFGMSYISTVIPGCIGARRKDRIAKYFKRSLITTNFFMIPFYVLNMFAGVVMEHLGVPGPIANEVGLYCRWMILSSILMVLEFHVENIFINLGYAKCATFNSLVTGLGVDVTCTYLMIYKYSLGVKGAAFANIAVKSARLLVWLSLMLYFKLSHVICIGDNKEEPLLSWKEFKVFWKLAVPTLLSYFSGWFIFELQIMMLANIRGISPAALAAGAIWVQSETTLAAIQTGWLSSTSMRTISLLGKRDQGAPKSFALLCGLSGILVFVTNIPLLVPGGVQGLCHLVSNDADVRHWFRKIAWVLVAHSQTRIFSINAMQLFIPLGKGFMNIVVTFASFYFIATPVAGAIAMTDLFTDDVALKMMACVGASTVAQVLLSLFGFGYLLRMDWDKSGKLIAERANNDKVPTSELDPEQEKK